MNAVYSLCDLMNYERAVLFPRARDAVAAYVKVTGKVHPIPANVCPALAEVMPGKLVPVSEKNGLAPGVPVQLYGYRQIVGGAELEIDPLMTGCMGVPFAKHSVVSFGYSKTIDLGAGGAFLTNDESLANEMAALGGFPRLLIEPLTHALDNLFENIKRRFERLAIWDADLEDEFDRPPDRQVIPWRVIRLALDNKGRDQIVRSYRETGRPIGTNYKSLLGGPDPWGNRILNFFLEEDP